MNIQKHIYYFILISFSILIANFIWPLINVTNNLRNTGGDDNDYDIDFASDEIEISSLISELILNEMKLQYICNYQ